MKEWTREEIKDLVQKNDTVLYSSLKKLYSCQTADEQTSGNTKHCNRQGFNGIDAPILTSCSQFLIKNGFLTSKQKVLVRKKLIKYTGQITLMANDHERNKELCNKIPQEV